GNGVALNFRPIIEFFEIHEFHQGADRTNHATGSRIDLVGTEGRVIRPACGNGTAERIDGLFKFRARALDLFIHLLAWSNDSARRINTDQDRFDTVFFAVFSESFEELM